jgi:uncharacterized membrane-anchored protein
MSYIGLSFFPIFLLVGVLFFIFWIIMLIDSITRKFRESTEKIVWVLVNIFTGIIGALIYYFIVYKKAKGSLRWFWWILLVLIVLGILFFFLALPVTFTR